jgi:hypothetical protein
MHADKYDTYGTGIGLATYALWHKKNLQLLFDLYKIQKNKNTAKKKGRYGDC